MILAPLRTMRVSFISASQNSSGCKRERAGLEAEKRLFEPLPFVLDHAPGKTRRKHPLGHFGQNAVVAELGERLRIGLRRQQLVQRLGPALRFSARARMVLNGIMVCELLPAMSDCVVAM